jgi:hypothetical protein
MLKSFVTVAAISISLLLAGCPQVDVNRTPHELDEMIYTGKMNWLSPNLPALNLALMACALQEAQHLKQEKALQQTPSDMFKPAPTLITKSPRCDDRQQEAEDLWQAIETCNANKEWEIPRCLELDQWMHAKADGEKERENGVNVYVLRHTMTQYFHFDQPTIIELPYSPFWLPANPYLASNWQGQDRRAIMHRDIPYFFWIPELFILIVLALSAVVFREKIINLYRQWDYKRQKKAEEKQYLQQSHEREMAEKLRQQEQAEQRKIDEERLERIKAQQEIDEQLQLKKEAEKLQKMDEEAAEIKKMLDDSFNF